MLPSGRDQRRDSRCCVCRTTGYGTAGSPTPASATICSSSKRRDHWSIRRCGTTRPRSGTRRPPTCRLDDPRAMRCCPRRTGWDDLALWTGSVARGDDGVWRIYYTALSTAGHGVLRPAHRPGRVRRPDQWRRVGDAPAASRPIRAGTRRSTGPAGQRDLARPVRVRRSGGDGWHMLITARDRDAPRFSDGVLAHARSHDMRTWELGRRLPGPPGSGRSRWRRCASSTGSRCCRSPATRRSRATEQTSASAPTALGPCSAARSLGPWDLDAGPPVRGRAEAVRGAARPAARRRLGLPRLPQPGA